jgi:hypothetical protein
MPDLPTVVYDVGGSAGAVIAAVNGGFTLRNGQNIDANAPQSSVSGGNGMVSYNGPAGVVSGALVDGSSN